MIVSVMTVFLVGCGNSMVEKSFEKLKSFVENKEYEKAITSLEMILDKDKENEEANKLYEIIDSYQKAKEAFEEEDFEEAEEILDSIDKEYKNYPIKDDIDKLKKDLEQNSNEDSKETEEEKEENVQYNQEQELAFSNITASSQLYDSTGKSYSPHKVIDHDSSTTWAEGVGGFGRNEWIQLDLGQVKTVKRLGIINGLVNSNNGYYKNNRLKEARLEFSDGGSMVINLSDNNSGEQQINLGENGVRTSFIRLVILDAYKGNKFDDTCISTIRAYGN